MNLNPGQRFPYIWHLISAAMLVICVCVLQRTGKLPWQYHPFDTEMPQPFPAARDNSILIFSKTNGFRHASIETGVDAIKKAGQKNGWNVETTENGALFNPDYLRRFKVVVFLSTTGKILSPPQKLAFENYMENGGGYAGIHSATDTEHKWKWYKTLLGATFRNHTFLPYHMPEAEIITEAGEHPINRGLPPRWKKVDEWYNFDTSARGKPGFQVLLSLNEHSYPSVFGKMEGDHPISWTHLIGKGRMFYTALGHNKETFADQYAMLHIMQGIAWAGRFE